MNDAVDSTMRSVEPCRLLNDAVNSTLRSVEPCRLLNDAVYRTMTVCMLVRLTMCLSVCLSVVFMFAVSTDTESYELRSCLRLLGELDYHRSCGAIGHHLQNRQAVGVTMWKAGTESCGVCCSLSYDVITGGVCVLSRHISVSVASLSWCNSR